MGVLEQGARPLDVQSVERRRIPPIERDPTREVVDGVDPIERPAHRAAILERRSHDLRAEPLGRCGIPARQHAQAVAVAREERQERRAEEAGAAGDEEVHFFRPSPRPSPRERGEGDSTDSS